MAEGSSGASALLGVIIGALIVVGVAVYAFGGFKGGGGATNVNITSAAPSSGGGAAK